MTITSPIKSLASFAISTLLIGCNTYHIKETSERATTTKSASLNKLALAKERMKILKLEMKKNNNREDVEKNYIDARCDFLRESEYLYSTHARIPCHVTTISLREKENDYIDRANSSLTKNFKDPESARFRNVFLSQIDVPVVCGEVNGKNSYGAYTGYKKYYATDTENFSGLDDNSSEFLFIWNNYCQN